MKPQEPLDRAQQVMRSAKLPDATKSALEDALRDASLRGFLIDLEQLKANLSLLREGVSCRL